MKSLRRQNADASTLQACAPQKQKRAHYLFLVRIASMHHISLHDTIRSSIRRLRRGHAKAARRTGRSCRHLAAIQSRYSLREILRQAGSTIVPSVVRKMGVSDSTDPETERVVFSKHWRRAVEPDVAARDRFSVTRSFCSAEHDPLDQIDSDRRSHIRSLQADQFETVSERLSRIHFPFHMHR